MSFRFSGKNFIPFHKAVIPACIALSACVSDQATYQATGDTGVQIGYTPDAAPVNRRTGMPEPGCWALDYEPAVTETITQNVQTQREKRDRDGTVTEPAIWRSETTTRIVTPRQTLNFETPCANMLTEEFLTSLQRSLQVRGDYEGTISGQMDRQTRMAIRQYQVQNGLNSAYLSLENARALGLVEVPRPPEAEATAPETPETVPEPDVTDI